MKKIFLINLLVILVHFCFSQITWKIRNDASITNLNETTGQYQGDGIIGSWSLMLQAFDDNSNGKLDDAERNKGNTNKHFYQFNADGTCLIHTLKLKGYYEQKNEGGRKRLYTYVYDEGTPVRENAWYLISVSKTELILLSQDKYAFWIFKRV